jgi:hypothetical protein
VYPRDLALCRSSRADDAERGDPGQVAQTPALLSAIGDIT